MAAAGVYRESILLRVTLLLETSVGSELGGVFRGKEREKKVPAVFLIGQLF